MAMASVTVMAMDMEKTWKQRIAGFILDVKSVILEN